MKKQKIIIHMAKHLKTGAEIPVLITKVDKNNVVEAYEEWTEKRKGFTLRMLQNRWDKCREDAIEILQRYEVPGYLKHDSLDPTKMPVDVAIFWEEYIYALEKKEKLSHNKVKSKYFEFGSIDN